MGRLTAYRVLCGVWAVAVILVGAFFTLSGFTALSPGGNDPGALPLGPGGVYMMAFAGTSLIGWGGGLLAAARNPRAGRTVGTMTALTLTLMAAYRMWAWLWGDYHVPLGDLPRFEAALFLVIGLGFLWLRPPKQERGG